MARTRIYFSLTETPQFRRLVTFLEDVEALADQRVDLELRDLVEEVRSDLLEASD